MQFSVENDVNRSVKSPFILICDILNTTVDDLSIINAELKELRERSVRLEERNESLLRRLREALRGVRETEKVDVSTQSDILSVRDVGLDCMEKAECIDVFVSTENEMTEVNEQMDLDHPLLNSNLVLESISMDYSISPVSMSDIDNVDHLYSDFQVTFENIELSKDIDFKSFSVKEDIDAIMEIKENHSQLSSIDKGDIPTSVEIIVKPLINEIVISQTQDQIDSTVNNQIVAEHLPINTSDIPEHKPEDRSFDDIMKPKAVTKSLNIDDLIVKPLPAVNIKTRSKYSDKVISSTSSPDKVVVMPKPIYYVKTKSKSIDKVSSSSLPDDKTKSILVDKNVVTPQKTIDGETYSKADMLFYLERYKIYFLAFVQSNTNSAEDISGGCKDLIRSFSNNSCESSEKKKYKRRRDSHSRKPKFDEKLGVIDTGDKCADENNRDLYDDLDFHDTHSSNISESDIAKVGGAHRLAAMSDHNFKIYSQKFKKISKAKKLSAESWGSQLSNLSTSHDMTYPPSTTVKTVDIPTTLFENQPKVGLDVKNNTENEFSIRMKERLEKKYGSVGNMTVISTLPRVVNYDLSVTDGPIVHEERKIKLHGTDKEPKNVSSSKDKKQNKTDKKKLLALTEVKQNLSVTNESIKDASSDRKDLSAKSTIETKLLTSRSDKRSHSKHKSDKSKKRRCSKTITKEKDLEEGEIM